MGSTARILGIDPGSRITGYGVLDVTGQRQVRIASGCIRIDAVPFPERLHRIFEGVSGIVAEFRPTEIAIERVFMSRNADSALKLGQARGAALCATFAGGAAVHEYAAREVKLAVVGAGSADKRQVQHMVRVLLRLEDGLQADEADALAVALCHANARLTSALLNAAGSRRNR